MPQQISPMIPRGATEINETTGVIRDDFEWRYFLGPYIFFKHAAGDQKGFRFATSSLIANGICRPVEIIKTFGVSKSSVNRYLRLYRTEGICLVSLYLFGYTVQLITIFGFNASFSIYLLL